MARDYSPDKTHMRYECDECQARESMPLGEAPEGWLVEFARDLCGQCSARERRTVCTATKKDGTRCTRWNAQNVSGPPQPLCVQHLKAQ